MLVSERLSKFQVGTVEWERERCLILRDAIKSAPEHLQLDLLKLQYELDFLREKCTQQEFLKVLFDRITENLENISDGFTFIKHKLEDLK